jgi:hypothetical protein
MLDDGFRIEEQKSAVATASAVRDPLPDIEGAPNWMVLAARLVAHPTLHELVCFTAAW